MQKKQPEKYYINCIVHNRRCHKTACKKCGMHYCDEFYTEVCPESGEKGIYHPAKDERDLPLKT